MWYQREGFEASSQDELRGITFEASVHYYHHKTALENLHAILPCSRIIWILRNPLPRAFSEYLHQAVKSKSYPTFVSILSDEVRAIKKCSKGAEESYVEGFENKLFKCLAGFKLKKYTLSTGFYAYFIQAWTQKFPFEQNLFLDYDSFRSNPQKTLNKISHFLGIATFENVTARWKYNKANTRDGVAKSLRQKNGNLPLKLTSDLVTIVQPQVEKVYELVKENYGWKLGSLT